MLKQSTYDSLELEQNAWRAVTRHFAADKKTAIQQLGDSAVGCCPRKALSCEAASCRAGCVALQTPSKPKAQPDVVYILHRPARSIFALLPLSNCNNNTICGRRVIMSALSRCCVCLASLPLASTLRWACRRGDDLIYLAECSAIWQWLF
jgi:hypothetical protein